MTQLEDSFLKVTHMKQSINFAHLFGTLRITRENI